MIGIPEKVGKGDKGKGKQKVEDRDGVGGLGFNGVVSITESPCPDPWVVEFEGMYYMVCEHFLFSLLQYLSSQSTDSPIS